MLLYDMLWYPMLWYALVHIVKYMLQLSVELVWQQSEVKLGFLEYNNLCVCVGGGGSLMAKVCGVDWGYVGLYCDRVAPIPGCFPTPPQRGGGGVFRMYVIHQYL